MGKKKKDGPGLWQILYSDLKPDRDISGRVDSSSGGEMDSTGPRNVNSTAALFSVDDDSDQELENDPFIASNATGGMGGRSNPRRTVVVVSERELDSKRPFFAPKSGQNNEEEEEGRDIDSIDIDGGGQEHRGGSFHGNRFRIRRDSDLELALPASSSQKLMKKCSYFCIYCFKMPIWKTYFTVVLIGIVMVLLYVLIIVVIVKGLGG